MYIRMVMRVIVLFVLVSFAGQGLDVRHRVAIAADGDQIRDRVRRRRPNRNPVLRGNRPRRARLVSMKCIRRSRIFRNARISPRPEGAYAAIHRAYAAEGDAAWKRLSVPELAAKLPDAAKKPLPKEAAERFLNAEILEVHVWDGVHAEVIAQMIEAGGAHGSARLDARRRAMVEQW